MRGTSNFWWQVFRLNHLRRGHHGQPVANVFKLTDIAREAKGAELLQGGIRNALGLHAQLLGALLQKMPR